MLRFSLLVVALLVAGAASAQTPRLNPEAPAWAFTNGQWYDGAGGFAPGTRYAVGGVFTADSSGAGGGTTPPSTSM